MALLLRSVGENGACLHLRYFMTHDPKRESSKMPQGVEHAYELKRIKADGKKTARIALIGECGGREEAIKLRPFVGWSGKLLAKWWSEVGLSRSDLWIDNVYPFTPPSKGRSPRLELVHPEDIKFWSNDLHARLAELSNVNVIVPTGDLALKAITGLKGITKYRGSILSYKDRIKVIPTIHPAATARRPLWAKACIADWRRIAEEVHGPEIKLPEREHFTHPTIDDLYWFKDDYLKRPKGGPLDEVLATDAEWPNKVLTMVGFSDDPKFSFIIPTLESYWGSASKLKQAIDVIKAIWEDESIPKVLQHGHSDAFVLMRKLGIELHNYQWDILAMHHCLEPNDEHSLAYQASVLTREPYWKDDAKDPELMARYASNYEAARVYCGKDNCVTKELFLIHYAELERREMIDYYHDNYSSLFEPMIDMMLTGIRVDEPKRRQRQMQLQSEVISIQDKISEIVGEQCYAKKSLKGSVLMRYFHEELKLPKVMRTRKKKGGEKVKTPSIDEVVIRRYMIKHESAKKLGALVLDHRRKHVLMQFYSGGRVDEDGRFRSTYGPYADTGRFRSGESPLGSGGNGQNVDRETRDVYVPDDY